MSARLILAGLWMAALTSAARAEPCYQLASSLAIPSATAPNWDYLTFDSSRRCLYIARRDDGVLIYDAATKRLTGVIGNTVGGNATTLVSELDRGFVTNLDGSLTTFELSTLKTLDRVSYGRDADNAFYDPSTQQLLVTMGDSKKAVFIDARTGRKTGALTCDSEKLEGTVPDGEGHMFMALRDRNKILKIDMKTRRIVAEWPTPGFTLPNGAAYDARNRRLFISTRGDNPSLLVIDPSDGRIVASPAIGRGNDVIVFDPESRQIYSANGFDGTLVVIQQDDADHYHLAEAATTRPYARTMAIDPRTKDVYLVTAEGTVDPKKPWKASIAPFYPNRYFSNTFTLLVYSRR